MTKRARQQARTAPKGARFSAWLAQHANSGRETLKQHWQNPLATALTVATIAIALALPAALYTLTENVKALGGQWDSSAAISLFLAPQIDEEQAMQLAEQLRTRSDVARTLVISRQDGLDEFRAYSGLGAALDQLSDNPLPVVISVYASPFVNTKDELEKMARAFEQIEGADFARLDTEWVQRLQALVKLLHQALGLLGVALGSAVFLVIGNSIRLEIENRRTEIEIMSLVGATSAFIRRPFLYSGAWYGLFGGALAWLLVRVAILWLQGPADQLAISYHSAFEISGLGVLATLVLISGAGLLGIIGSWLAVSQHLARLEPTR